ncbi:unnamed protein product [Closterium sp. NIES-64]|nr:unnamed protein product [Closterium sp. NIES-64]CAI6000329.1 unnamed protein product [Closterium sp. NIES-65]
MVKLISRKIDQLAEGASVGGGADHEGGGKKTGRVVIEYSVEEEEEEIEEDTSRQAQHGASGPGGDANQDEDSSSESSPGSSSSDESVEDDGEGAGHRTERTGEHGVALGERVDERVELIEQQATGETKTVEEQEGGAAAQEGGVGGQQQVVGEVAAQEGGAGGQQQEGVAATQVGGAGVQQQEFRVAAARVSGSGGQEQEVGEAVEEYRRGDERQAAVTRSHRTASGSGQAGPSTGCPSTAGQSTANVAPGGQVVELLQRVEKVEASQKQLVADVFAKHTEQAGVFNRLAADFRTAWNTISESSKSTLSQCAEAVKGVTAERNLLEGARAKIDEMSGKIIEGVVAAITKASEDAVEKQLKQVEERLVAAVLKGFEKAIMEDMFCSTLPPETMKELKDIVREGYQEAEAGRLEVLVRILEMGFSARRARRRGRVRRVWEGFAAGLSLEVTSGRFLRLLRWEDMSAARLDPHRRVAVIPSPSPSPKSSYSTSGGAGKGAGEASAGLLSKPKAASAAHDGGAGHAAGLVGNWASSSTPPLAPFAAAPSLGNVCLSDPGSPSKSKKKPAATKSSKHAAHATESLDVVELSSVPGQAPVEKTSIVVAARQEKAKKARVTGHTPPPRPDDQGKTRGCKRPFKGPGFGLRKGKLVSEQTVGGRKRFLGTFETEKDQKFCTAVCWRVYFPDVVLTEYEGYTAQDEEDWKVYLDAAAEMPTGVWSVAQEQGECRFDDYLSLLATAKREAKAGTERGIALCVAIGKVATLGLKHGNLIYPVPKGMAATPHMMAIAATVASLWAACRKLSREDIKKDALAAANGAIYAPETAKKACVAAMSALVSILLHVGKTFPAKQWPDHLYSSAVEGLGSTDAILLQMLRVAAQVCTQWCCCRAAARLLEDAGYGSLAMPEEKSKAKQGVEDAAETETSGQGE